MPCADTGRTPLMWAVTGANARGLAVTKLMLEVPHTPPPVLLLFLPSPPPPRFSPPPLLFSSSLSP
eukprot:1884209-Rhodomonas_salina.1